MVFPGLAFSSWLDGVANAVNTYDQVSNKYFYAALALWPAMLMGIGKLRQGERLSPPMARATAFTMFAINAACICLLVVHFAPETSSIIEFVANIFKRIFG